MPGINMADVIEAVAEAQPDAIAQVQGERRFTWSQLDRRTNSLARCLLELGVERQDKVAQYLHNGPEYVESVVAACKASLVPVNTNYRYLERELLYLWDNADVVAVVFHGCFTERIAGLRRELERVRGWIRVDDGSGPCPDWAIPYESATTGPLSLGLPWRRDGDDLFLVYTGGTTGMPKGVMWRQGDYFQVVNRERPTGPYDLSRGRDGIIDKKREEGPGRVVLPTCPQMHALGLMGSVSALLNGGSVVTLASTRFDAEEALDLIERERVGLIYIVGDAFARPLLEALDAAPGRWDLSSVAVMRSAGVMWSEEVKRGLLRHHSGMVLRDGLGSTEAVRMGRSESSGSDVAGTATFDPGPDTLILDDDLAPIPAGSSVAGRLAVGGSQPLGYYKDPEKTASTFVTVEGCRYVVPGDYALYQEDGSIRLLGRGSICINTGGEKVFPEEVEEVLKRHPSVRDAVCVGLPDPRLGETVTAVVEPAADAGAGPALVEEALIGWVKEQLAHYKAPRRLVAISSIGRAANGKVDYKRLREYAIRELGRYEAV